MSKQCEKNVRGAALRRYRDRFDENCEWRQREEIGLAMSVEYAIECTFCGETDSYDVDLNAAVAYAMRRGWKYKYGHTLCPSCATLSREKIESGEL